MVRAKEFAQNVPKPAVKNNSPNNNKYAEQEDEDDHAYMNGNGGGGRGGGVSSRYEEKSISAPTTNYNNPHSTAPPLPYDAQAHYERN
eukprot:gene40006-49459_t